MLSLRGSDLRLTAKQLTSKLKGAEMPSFFVPNNITNIGAYPLGKQYLFLPMPISFILDTILKPDSHQHRQQPKEFLFA
jgi:uncharacterized protein YceK